MRKREAEKKEKLRHLAVSVLTQNESGQVCMYSISAREGTIHSATHKPLSV